MRHFLIAGLTVSLLTLGCSTGTKTRKLASQSEPGRLKVAHLSVHEYGTGSKFVILVHGGPGLGGYMKTLGKDLAPEFRVVEYFQRDTPESQLTAPFTVADHVEDLKLMVDAYTGAKKPIVVGHSWGGALVTAFAGTYPGLADRIVVVDSGPLNDETRVRTGKNIEGSMTAETKAALKAVSEEFDRAQTQDEKNRLFLKRRDIATRVYFKDSDSAVSLPVTSFDHVASGVSRADYEKKMKDGYFIQKLHRIQDRVVVIHGKEDPIPYQETFELFERHVPSSKRVLVDHGGHYPWLDKGSRRDFLVTLVEALK